MLTLFDKRCTSVLLWAFLLAGCASGASSEAMFLLEQDYLAMTDAELIAFEQELSDELLRTACSGNGALALGIGIGSWGGDVDYAVHTDKWLGGSGSAAATAELFRLRDNVRDEMKRRLLVD